VVRGWPERNVVIRVSRAIDADDAWIAMRCALWPEFTAEEHRADATRMLSEPQRFVNFLAYDEETAVGFADASLRFDYVNGCGTSPVVFLEGIYVRSESRRKGVARALCAAVEAWGRSNGCVELGSDALVDNEDSHRMHAALGFSETERVVYFRKALFEDRIP
jgi:aminoglycoside 6'-N-acetyltransferase I